MSTREFLASVALLVTAMGLIEVIELAAPLVARPPAGRSRIPGNLALSALTLILNWALTSAAAVLALAWSFEQPRHLAEGGIAAAVSLVTSIAILDCFFGYLAHRTMHMWAPLWRVHRVHHSDAFVDVTTAYRTHPIEVLWRFVFLIVPIWVAGIAAPAVVLYRLLSALNGLLEHANIRVWPRLDSAVSLFVVTPNMHKVHHSRNPAETNSNYGNIVSLFDRILRTFTPTARAISVVYGLEDTAADGESFVRLLAMPLAARHLPRAVSNVVVWAVVALGLLLAVRPVWARGLDTAKIEQLTGAKGTLDEKAGVFKVSAPRSDLAVTVAGVKLSPAMGLTSWAAFEPAGEQVMVMGDMVLQEDQVVPVMDAALNNGLEVTGLHNHFLGDTPRVMFMHIGGSGDQTALATAVGKVFATIQQTSGGKGRLPSATIDPAASQLDAAVLDGILGTKGAVSGGVYKGVVGRTTTMHGTEVGSTMGVNTWFAFAGNDQQAVVDGDFAMEERELQPVLKALRKADIAVVAIHNHMTMEDPRILFLHFWGVGPARSLATGIRSALDVQRK